MPERQEGTRRSLCEEEETVFRPHQAHLLRAETLAVLGVLVADLLHDLNTPLAAAKGFAEVLLGQSLPAEAKQDLQRVREGVEDALRLLHRFRNFVREVPGRPMPVDINTLLENALALRGSSLRSENIAVRLELAPDLPPVQGTRRALGLAFMSLILNAEEAMYHTFGEGTLRLRTSLAQKGMVRVEISDDGPGIPPEVQERAFQPFVSTKGARGTGLGLTLARHVVEEHGGTIRFTTARGEEGPSGTTFVVELPAATAQERIASAAAPSQALAPKGRILVVDDEPSVCELIRRALAARGHIVDTAETVEQALEKLEAETYQAIVCDIRMPGQSGIALHSHVAEATPDLARRVLFMTGSPLEPQIEAFLAHSGCPHLRKPFEIPDLVRLVEGLLAQGVEDA